MVTRDIPIPKSQRLGTRNLMTRTALVVYDSSSAIGPAVRTGVSSLVQGIELTSTASRIPGRPRHHVT